MDKVIEKVRVILQDQLGVNEDQITPGSTLAALGADDLDLVEIFMGLEKEFDITIPQSDDLALSKKTVQGIVDYITARIKR